MLRPNAKFILLALLLALQTPAAAQGLSTPLTYEECIQRRTEFWEKARSARRRALDFVMHVRGAFAERDATLKPMEQEGDDAENAALSLHCAFRPQQSTDGETGTRLKQMTEAANLLRQWAYGREELSLLKYETKQYKKWALSDSKEQFPVLSTIPTVEVVKPPVIDGVIKDRLNFVDVSRLPGIDTLIKDRLKEAGDNAQAALTELDHVGKSIQGIDIPTAIETRGTASIDYTRIGSLDSPDRPSKDTPEAAGSQGSAQPDIPAQGTAVSKGNGTIAFNYAAMFAEDFKKAEDGRAAARQQQAAAHQEQASRDAERASRTQVPDRPMPAATPTSNHAATSQDPVRYAKGGSYGTIARVPPGGYACLDDFENYKNVYKWLRPGERTIHMQNSIWICRADGSFVRGN